MHKLQRNQKINLSNGLSKNLRVYLKLVSTAHPRLEYDNRLKGAQNIKAGTTLTLPVDISGIPSPMVTWLLDEEPVEKSPRISIDTTNEITTLTVKNAMLDDSGLYTVEAENVVGKAVADFEVNVQGNKIIIIPHKDFKIHVLSDTLIFLKCTKSS